MNEWNAPNTITGDAATGDRYFQRKHINEEFWIEVLKGNHILFVAPRRVGKTSIMQDLAENPPNGYYCIYQDIEGVKTVNEFYKRLFELILQCVNKVEKAKTMISKWLKHYEISEIGKTGIKINRKEINYEEEVKSIVPQLADLKIHVVLFLDEFAEVINKIKKSGSKEDAANILHTLREIRHDDNFRHFTVVFAGSIGLHHVVKDINRPKLINDLHSVSIGPLSPEEGKTLVNQLTREATVQYNEGLADYLLQKIDHLLPYHVQLMLEEVDLLARKKNEPTIMPVTIDEAFQEAVEKTTNFDDWLSRLKEYLPDYFPFVNSILKKCAHHTSITIQEIYNLALKHKREEDYMDFIDQLVTDGYIIKMAEKRYRFLSPFLQAFWLKKFPIYDND